MNMLRKERLYTVDDIFALPDGERAELLDGEIYYMAPPSWTHQRLVSELHYEIKNYIKTHGGGCEVLPSPFAVFLNDDALNYVEPDISVVCDKAKLDEKGCHGAPDWVVEIVSPSSRSMDYFKKLIKYRAAGVKEYWVVDADRKATTVYHFESDEMEEYPFAEDVPAGIYENFSINIKNGLEERNA